MSGKNKKKYTFDSLVQELDSIQQSKKKDIKAISDIFGRIQDIKGLKKEEINTLFYKAINLLDKDSWKFVLEIYSRFYNRMKVKSQKEMILLIEDETKKRLNAFLAPNEINSIVSSIVDEGRSLFEKQRM